MVVRIKENPNQNFWYRFLAGKTFIIKISTISDLIDVDGVDRYYPENYYLVTQGNHKGYIISKKDCVIIDEGKEIPTFKECCIETRKNFVNKIREQKWNTEMRATAEDLLIVYDQMMEKLSFI